MKLNARQVETAKPKDKPYKLADGGEQVMTCSLSGPALRPAISFV